METRNGPLMVLHGLYAALPGTHVMLEFGLGTKASMCQ